MGSFLNYYIIFSFVTLMILITVKNNIQARINIERELKITYPIYSAVSVIAKFTIKSNNIKKTPIPMIQ